jgi:hypothetical protein
MRLYKSGERVLVAGARANDELMFGNRAAWKQTPNLIDTTRRAESGGCAA